MREGSESRQSVTRWMRYHLMDWKSSVAGGSTRNVERVEIFISF